MNCFVCVRIGMIEMKPGAIKKYSLRHIFLTPGHDCSEVNILLSY